MSKELLHSLRALGIELQAKGDRLSWRAQKGRMTPDFRKRIRANKAGLLATLRKTRAESYHPKRVNQIWLGDCLAVLKKMPDNTIDQIVTDPPYGIKFMGKNWDKKLPEHEIWRQCLRVLKPGAFAFIMASPRQDVLSRMIRILEEVGFIIGFTSLYWTYATGFPKAHNIDKAVGKNLVGSYAGFQPKPAVEVILVVMKPCEKRSYTEQALANGKGLTWLDDCRIPYGDETPLKGRFPANIVISDDVLDDGRKHQGGTFPKKRGGTEYFGLDRLESGISGRLNDSGGYSRFFSLDVWADLNLQDLPEKVQQNLPFFIIPKASKKEKDAGCENFPVREKDNRTDTAKAIMTKKGLQPSRNNHPTVKPLTLMSYLITMGSRQDDVVLDPFCGSGTVCLAAFSMKRKSIGIEKNPEYFKIAQARIRALVLESYRKKDTA